MPEIVFLTIKIPLKKKKKGLVYKRICLPWMNFLFPSEERLQEYKKVVILHDSWTSDQSFHWKEHHIQPHKGTESDRNFYLPAKKKKISKPF